MSTSGDRLVSDYLDRLELELADFPSARRRELVQEISEHIAEARAGVESESEADVRNLLDRMGDPADIAAEARGAPEEPAETPAAPAVTVVEPRGSALDVVAMILLLIGGIVLPVVGWLVGVVLLWVSNSWTTNEKLIGTLVVPGGLAPAVYLSLAGTYTETCFGTGNGPTICTGGPSPGMRALGIVLVLALFVLPLMTTAFLARRRARSVAFA